MRALRSTRSGIIRPAFDQRRTAGHRLQHVVEIMRDAAGDLAQRMHPFGVGRTLLRRLAGRDLFQHPLLQPGIDLLLHVQQVLLGIDVQEDAQRLLHPAVLPAQRDAADAEPGLAAVVIAIQEIHARQRGLAQSQRAPDRVVLGRHPVAIRFVGNPFAARRHGHRLQDRPVEPLHHRVAKDDPAFGINDADPERQRLDNLREPGAFGFQHPDQPVARHLRFIARRHIHIDADHAHRPPVWRHARFALVPAGGATNRRAVSRCIRSRTPARGISARQ